MMKRRLILSFMFMLIVTASAHANTVEYVSLVMTSNESEDASLDSSFEHPVSNSGWIQGYRLPFITDEDHEVTIIGHLTDFLDRVEIVHGSSIERTIKKEDLVWVGNTNEHGGKGKIVFKVKSSDLPGIGQSFKIRVRFAVELAGYDQLHCKVVRRGTINRVDWTTANEAELPELDTENSNEELTRDHVYSLKFTCANCAASIQVSDGITTKLLGQTVMYKSVWGGTQNRRISTTFRLSDIAVQDGNVRRLVKLADSGIGNIRGGWGDYVYARLKPSLPGRTAAEPNRTSLERVQFTTGNNSNNNSGNNGNNGNPGNTGTGTWVGCQVSTPAPTTAPVIEGPIVNSCVGSPAGDRASVNFDFSDVKSACGNAAYQIEIQRVDANCAPVNWTGPGTGLNHFGRCWISDQNNSFHSVLLDRGTTYRWRARGNSSGSTIGAGPWSPFQTFTTGSAPAMPTFTGQPTEGSQVHMGNAVGSTVNVNWTPTGCDGASFSMRVLEDGLQSATINGIGDSAAVPIRRGHAYHLELTVTTNWGTSPPASLRFSTTQ